MQQIYKLFISSGLCSETISWSKCKMGTEIFKDLPGECNEFFMLDVPAEEQVNSHAQFILCNRLQKPPI